MHDDVVSLESINLIVINSRDELTASTELVCFLSYIIPTHTVFLSVCLSVTCYYCRVEVHITRLHDNYSSLVATWPYVVAAVQG